MMESMQDPARVIVDYASPNRTPGSVEAWPLEYESTRRRKPVRVLLVVLMSLVAVIAMPLLAFLLHAIFSIAGFL
jgi:hypothetical protein